ncbi:FxDxF family PEP-CTERM protein [Roseateles sp.]|uniref:FxDxF family PEP-CTERM protein n=1 Tax=Roseateles sp. TaxID=1971397 RepID=UPI003BA8DAF3
MKFRPHLIAAAALIAASAAHADSFNFSGTVDAGPLSGQTFAGSYTFNAAQVSGSAFEQLALSAFTLNFNSVTYTLNGSATADYADGVFLGLSYTSTNAAGTLSLLSGSMDVTDAFLHFQPTTGLESSGGYTVTAVPEPETWALMLGGLGAIGMLARRRKI